MSILTRLYQRAAGAFFYYPFTYTCTIFGKFLHGKPSLHSRKEEKNENIKNSRNETGISCHDGGTGSCDLPHPSCRRHVSYGSFHQCDLRCYAWSLVRFYMCTGYRYHPYGLHGHPASGTDRSCIRRFSFRYALPPFQRQTVPLFLIRS